MPKVNSQVPHSLGKDKARQQIDRMLTKVRDQYPDMVKNLEGSWESDTLNLSFTAYGFDISSEVEVGESVVDVRGKLPLAAAPFKGKIQKTIVSKLEELLA